MWANFKQKGKAIALHFDEKLPIFNAFHVAQKLLQIVCEPLSSKKARL